MGNTVAVSCSWWNHVDRTNGGGPSALAVETNFAPCPVHGYRDPLKVRGPERVMTGDHEDCLGDALCLRTIATIAVVFYRDPCNVFVWSRSGDLVLA